MTVIEWLVLNWKLACVVVVAWIIFSTILVTIICINSSRLSQRHDSPKRGDNDKTT